MPSIDEILREQSRPAANLEYKAATRAYWFKQFQDSGRDGIGVKPEAFVMYTGEIGTEIRHVWHNPILSCRRAHRLRDRE